MVPKRPATQHPYVLLLRGPDGRLRFERFADVDAYRRRLKEIDETGVGPLSIDEVVSLLDS